MNEQMVSLKADKGTEFGPLVIVKAGELATNGTTGLVAEGILEKTVPNKFNKPGQTRQDYYIRNPDNKTLYIIQETQAIKEQLGQPGTVGLWVKVNYNGKIKTKSGSDYHDFECFAKKAQ